MYLINKKEGTEFTFKNRTFSPQQRVLYYMESGCGPTSCCWSLDVSPCIPSFGDNLGCTILARALNDDGGHLTAS